MRIALFCHSLISDWNHGNAHFLRGVAAELTRRGHEVMVYEPRSSWSFSNYCLAGGLCERPALSRYYPELTCTQYDSNALDLERIVDQSDLVIVHEWNAPELVREVAGLRRAKRNFVAFFHDSHHRLTTQPETLMGLQLLEFDAVLAFGRSLADLYTSRGVTGRAVVWHEAADTRVFFPRFPDSPRRCDVVWIGNWGDDERTAELRQYFIQTVRKLGLSGQAFGVRYPDEALAEVQDAGISYQGWLPNYRTPEAFARAAFTIHIPRRPYRELLPGIPTIRVFEALACGIPLICSPWDDSEELFASGDFLRARDPEEMQGWMSWILQHPADAAKMAARARRRLLERHTCGHRVDELLGFYSDSLRNVKQRSRDHL